MTRIYEMSDSTFIDLAEVCFISPEYELKSEQGEHPGDPESLPAALYGFEIILRNRYAYEYQAHKINKLKSERKKLIRAWKRYHSE